MRPADKRSTYAREAIKKLGCVKLIIARNVRHFRVQRECSQSDLAYNIITSQNRIYVLENDLNSNVELLTLIKVANYLEVELEDLVTRHQEVDYTIKKNDCA